MGCLCTDCVFCGVTTSPNQWETLRSDRYCNTPVHVPGTYVLSNRYAVVGLLDIGNVLFRDAGHQFGWTRLVRLGLSANGIHGISISTDRPIVSGDCWQRWKVQAGALWRYAICKSAGLSCVLYVPCPRLPKLLCRYGSTCALDRNATNGTPRCIFDYGRDNLGDDVPLLVLPRAALLDRLPLRSIPVGNARPKIVDCGVRSRSR